MQVPANLHEYLAYLAKTTTLGRDANDVALSVLATRLEVMRRMPLYGYALDDDKAEGGES